MALKRLTTAEMVQLSGPMVTEGAEARGRLLAYAETAGVLPRLDVACKALHEAKKASDNPRLVKLQEEAGETDSRHDNLIRGAHGLLTSLALLAGTAERAEQLTRLRDTLLPEGLSATQQSYRAEAGSAQLLATRVADPVVKKQLKEIPVHQQTLWHVVQEWIGHARKLGELEDERAMLLTSAGPSENARMVAARNQWIRAMNALLTMAELAEVDPSVDQVVFGALRLAEKAADRRGKGPAGAEAEGATPTGAAEPVPA